MQSIRLRIFGGIIAAILLPLDTEVIAEKAKITGITEVPDESEIIDMNEWVKRWCFSEMSNYGWNHIVRCKHLGNDSKYVLSSYSCGTGCRLLNSQIEEPEKTQNGWIRVFVRTETWMSKYSKESNTWYWKNEGYRTGPRVVKRFWFAQCNKGLFAEGKSKELIESSAVSIYHDQGIKKGRPKTQTVYGGIFNRWQKLCKYESLR